MRKPWLFYLGLYAVLIAATTPLAMEWVPPNRWYGFRFPGARLAPHLWYDLNALGGRMFIAGLSLCLLVNLLLMWRGGPALRQNLPWINVTLVLVTFWIVTSELLRQLPG